MVTIRPPDPGSGDPPTHPDEPRRSFLARLSAGLAILGALLLGIPFIGFLLAPVERERPGVWRRVGRVDDFAPGTTVKVIYRDARPLPWAGFSAETAAWLRREGADQFTAFSIYCTHTGCPVRWEEGAQLFLCPCHGGAFDRNGAVAAGPPPRPLVRYPVRVRAGAVEIMTAPIPVPSRGP